MMIEKGWVAITHCPVCETVPTIGTFNYTPVTKIQVGEATIDCVTPVVWSKCSNCKLEFQSVRLDEESLNIYYSSDLYRILLNRDNQEFRDENARRFAKLVVAFLENTETTALRHLDFGCGQGQLLDEVPWMGVGIEISKNGRKWAEGLGVEVFGSLDEVEGKFDLITIIETLEHMPDPLGTLQSLYDLLLPGGRIMISVPWGGKHSGDKVQIGHLFSFRRDTLEFITEKVGFRGINVGEVNYSETGVALFYLGVKDAE